MLGVSKGEWGQRASLPVSLRSLPSGPPSFIWGRRNQEKEREEASNTKQSQTQGQQSCPKWQHAGHPPYTHTYARAQPHCTLTESPMRKTGVLLLWPAWEKRYTCECKYLNSPASKNKEGEGKAGPTHPLLSETQTPRGPRRQITGSDSAGTSPPQACWEEVGAWTLEGAEPRPQDRERGQHWADITARPATRKDFLLLLFLSVTLSSLSIRRVKLVLLLTDL